MSAACLTKQLSQYISKASVVTSAHLLLSS